MACCLMIGASVTSTSSIIGVLRGPSYAGCRPVIHGVKNSLSPKELTAIFGKTVNRRCFT